MIVALVLLSALLHALWNALLRLEPDKDRALVVAVVIATVLAATVAGVRWSLGEPPFAGATSLAWAAGAGSCEWLYFTSLARALAAGPLGPVYTISRGGAILAVWPLSIALYGEALTAPAAAGSVVVLAGLALSSLRTGDTRHAGRAAIAWAIACAAAIAGYHLAYKAALATGGNPSAVFAVALGVASSINVARIDRRGALAVLRSRALRIVGMGVVCCASFLILLEALTRGGAGFVLTLRNTSVLFATALAGAIGERPSRPQILGALLVAAGAAVMAWS